MTNREKTTLILGASHNPDRASYQAMVMMRDMGIPFFAVGRRDYEWGGLKIVSGKPEISEKIDTVTLYLNARNQEEYYDYILSLNPRRIIFNPGTTNDELYEIALERGIDAVERCMLVMLRSGDY